MESLFPLRLSRGTGESNSRRRLTRRLLTACLPAYGERLGLDIESGVEQRFGTALGVFIAYGHQVHLETLGFRFESYVFFASDDAMTKNVLGRRGWLDMLKVGIIDYVNELYVSRFDAI